MTCLAEVLVQVPLCFTLENNMSETSIPRWLRIIFAIIRSKYLKRTVGNAAILATLYLWYYQGLSEQKAVFGIILLTAGGFVTTSIDLIDLFKYIGNYKNKGTEDGSDSK